jgi:hypothetical protein
MPDTSAHTRRRLHVHPGWEAFRDPPRTRVTGLPLRLHDARRGEAPRARVSGIRADIDASPSARARPGPRRRPSVIATPVQRRSASARSGTASHRLSARPRHSARSAGRSRTNPGAGTGGRGRTCSPGNRDRRIRKKPGCRGRTRAPAVRTATVRRRHNPAVPDTPGRAGSRRSCGTLAVEAAPSRSLGHGLRRGDSAPASSVERSRAARFHRRSGFRSPRARPPPGTRRGAGMGDPGRSSSRRRFDRRIRSTRPSRGCIRARGRSSSRWRSPECPSRCGRANNRRSRSTSAGRSRSARPTPACRARCALRSALRARRRAPGAHRDDPGSRRPRKTWRHRNRSRRSLREGTPGPHHRPTESDSPERRDTALRRRIGCCSRSGHRQRGPRRPREFRGEPPRGAEGEVPPHRAAAAVGQAPDGEPASSTRRAP